MLAVLSGQRSKEKEAPSKVRIRQSRTERQRLLSGILHGGNQGPSLNYSREEVIAYVEQSLQEGGFSQLQVQGRCKDGSVLVSKRESNCQSERASGERACSDSGTQSCETVYIEGRNSGSIPRGSGSYEQRRKNPSSGFMTSSNRSNRFTEFIEDISSGIVVEREATILDFDVANHI